MPYFGQERMLAAQKKGPLTEAAYREALATNHRLSREEGIDATLHEHDLDAIVAPSGAPACLIDWVRGDQRSGGSSTAAAVAGYPNLTVPAGYVFGLPVGISFMAGAYQEPMLLRLGHAFERARSVRVPPEFKATVEFGG
jgi:amidase